MTENPSTMTTPGRTTRADKPTHCERQMHPVPHEPSRICADGGTTWTDLTGFQRDVLKTIRRCERGDPIPTGQTVKDYLETRYTDPINNGRLYQNLNHLIDCGLVDKGFVDGRTNTYHLADQTVDMLDRTIHRFADDCGVDLATSEG